MNGGAPHRAPGPWWRGLLAALRIEPTDDMHEPYRFLADVRLEGRPIVLATWPSTRYNLYWPNALKRPVTLIVNHLALLVTAARGLAGGHVVILREFTNGGMACLALPLWPWRRRLLLNVNDNLTPAVGAFSRLARAFVRRLGYTWLLLDGAEVRDELVRRLGPMALLTPYFVVPDRRPARAPRRADAPFRVGFVGYFRRDKGGVAALASAIRAVQRLPGVDVALGCWSRAQAEHLPADVRRALRVCDTLRYPDYLAFLDGCDAVVLLATPAYALRHSGVLVDAVSRGTPVLCRDYPLLACQALRPVPVGVTYRGFDDLPARVLEVQARRHEFAANFERYFRERALCVVQAVLEREWCARTQQAGAATITGTS